MTGCEDTETVFGIFNQLLPVAKTVVNAFWACDVYRCSPWESWLHRAAI
jgi:hypothetical protein